MEHVVQSDASCAEETNTTASVMYERAHELNQISDILNEMVNGSSEKKKPSSENQETEYAFQQEITSKDMALLEEEGI